MNLLNRTLIRGDNLQAMQELPDTCIDLIATDPPFNSKRDYFIPFRDQHGQEPDSLVKAFSDTWEWGKEADAAYSELLLNGNKQIGDTIEGLHKFLDETPMMAYLATMAIRIIEMHRILKPTGSLYLHCDPTASHYLKIVLDAIFGAKNFRNEIVWAYRSGGVSKNWFGRKHDIILFYTKNSRNIHTFNVQKERSYNRDFKPYRFKGVEEFEDSDGRWYTMPSMRDIWEIDMVGRTSNERASYPTQKPIALYKRIIEASSNAGDLVLDPFAGCGTTTIAAEQLGRQWVGIDLTYLAIGAVKLQIQKLCPQIRNQITILGTPENEEQALQLAQSKPQGFEEWCVSHVLQFKSNASKVADGGIDGTMRFPLSGKQDFGKAVAQVKGGKCTLGDVRDFRTAMQNVEADMGVFVAITPSTKGMRKEIARAGFYEHPFNQQRYPRLQYYQIQDYFKGKMPELPSREKVVL